MKVLIIQTGTIGEVVFTTPLIRALKKQRQASVEVLTTEAATAVLAANPNVDKVYSNTSLRTNLKQLSGHSYDFILQLDQSLQNFFLTLLLKGKTLRRRRFLLREVYRTQSPHLHLVDQYFFAADLLGIANDEELLDFFIPYKDEVPRDWLPEDFQREYVAFCISAPYETRKLPSNRLIELCDKINKPIILLGDFACREEGEKIELFFKRRSGSDPFEQGLLKLNKKAKVYNGCGKFNFNQQASVIRQSRVVFTFDDDSIAIASAFGKEVISIWGNTSPAFGTYPYHTRFTLLENNKLDCRPCSRQGFDACPQGHFKCMKENNLDFYL